MTLPNGDVKVVEAGQSPYDVAKGISNSLAKLCIVAKVDGKLYDLHRPFEADCTLELLKFDNPEAKEVFWHSSSHILGQAMERYYQCHLCKGPPIETGGFFYDMSVPEGGEKRY